jgi:hypothetical protein
MVSATSLTGAAGEHFVMSELLRRGMIAALAPAGVPNCDIVVTDDIGDRLCAVQVKTRLGKGADRGWHMSKKHEQLSSPSLFYCFVDFGTVTGEQPFTYVVLCCPGVSRCRVLGEESSGMVGKARCEGTGASGQRYAALPA